MQILITNIGNRNIKYQGKMYSDLEKQESRTTTSLSFRDWTKQLLDDFEITKDDIELNILDTVLNNPKIKPDKIFILVSNQENNLKFNGQDTLYEGEIIGRLIYSNYKIKDIVIKEITEDVTNENYLMQFYQQLYTCLLQEYKDAEFIFCDAGGTGQQKTASKIMAEFMLPDNQWKIVYPKKDGSVEEKTQIEYRNIINKEQAIALVSKSQYEAALCILGGNVNKVTDNKLFNLLSFIHFRNNKALPQTKKIWEAKNIPNRKDAVIWSAVNPQKREYSEDLYNLFLEQTYLFLSEALLVAYHKYLTGNYRESILDFAVFYEDFIEKSLSIIEKEIEKIISKPKYPDKIINKWIEDNRVNCSKTQNYAKINYKDTTYNYEAIPLAIHLIAEQDFFPELQPVAKILIPYLDLTYSPYKTDKQNSVREVRNKLAHEGKYVDKTILVKELPYYENLLNNCLTLWGLPQEDIYEQLNKMIEEQIRNY